MAITILKHTKLELVVAITGTETVTLTDYVISPQIAATPRMNIDAIHFAVPGETAATITRNSVVQWNLLGNYSFDFNGFADNRNNASNIVVAATATGTVILHLKKISGYGDDQNIPAV